MTFPLPTVADADADGLMPAAAYRAWAEVPPSDKTDPIPTTGASGVYNTGTLTVASSIDSIANLSVDRCYDTGHAAADKLVLCVVFQGFEQPKSGVTTALRQRFASYVDPESGRAMCVLARDSRGRGSASGTIDYCRDTQDTLDCVDAQAAALGSLAFDAGQTAIGVGYSTGAFDLALAACREPERWKVLVFVFGNTDLGVDPLDSYWGLHNGAVRASLTTTIGDRGEGTEAALDPYLARDPGSALGRLAALPNGPEIWIFGDRTDADLVGLPSPDRWAAAISKVPGAADKLHVHITQAGDDNRILHDSGIDSAAAILAERKWVPWALKNIAPWTMPRHSPPSGFRVLGWMRTRAVVDASRPIESRPGWLVWMGASSPPKSSATGGRAHAAEMTYQDTGRQFRFDPVTSQGGYLQIERDADQRVLELVAGEVLPVNLNVSPTISSVADLGFTDAFFSDAGGVVGGATVSAWNAEIGSKVFAADAVGTEPDGSGVDGDGVPYVGFTAGTPNTTGKRLVMADKLVTPTGDYTMIVVLSQAATTDGYYLEVQHHGDRSGLTLWTSSTTDRLSYTLANAASGLVGNIGAHVISTNAKHLFAVMRKSGVMYESLDGGAWSKSAVSSDASTWTDTGASNNKNTTSLGCGYANGGGVFWQHKTCRIYAVIAKDSATSEAGLIAARALLRDRLIF